MTVSRDPFLDPYKAPIAFLEWFQEKPSWAGARERHVRATEFLQVGVTDLHDNVKLVE